MNKYPKLRFQLNRELDNVMCFQFLDQTAGGIDFGKRIVELYHELQEVKGLKDDDKRVVIDKFTTEYYSKNEKRLEEILKNISGEWERVASDFFVGVDKIFNNEPWPKGEYICYVSIFDCNPRFLENKSFQVWMGLKDRTKYVIAHEMLHFMFFDYLDKYELDFKHKQGEDTIWLLSEWFNDLILNLPVFKKFGQNVKSGYPEVVEFSKRFDKMNRSELNAKKFFYLVKSKLY